MIDNWANCGIPRTNYLFKLLLYYDTASFWEDAIGWLKLAIFASWLFM